MKPQGPWLIHFTLLAVLSLSSNSSSAFHVGRSAVSDQAVQRSQEQRHNQSPSTSSNSVVTLEPLSLEPLLLVSRKPLLSEKECTLLSQAFLEGVNNNKQKEEGDQVLQSLQQRLDLLIGRNGDAEGVVRPRFLHYEPTNTSPTTNASAELLPDGLHVDNNNGFHFRYLTVLVYLTTNQHGATTFPLAKPMMTMMDADHVDETVGEKAALNAAQSLIDQNMQHTRQKGGNHEASRVVEQAALDLYHNLNNDNKPSAGVRVLPKRGHCTLFSSIDPTTGAADPRSWHGAEQVYDGETKQVLSFFYEVPVEYIASQAAFGAEAGRRYERLKQRVLRENQQQQDRDSSTSSSPLFAKSKRRQALRQERGAVLLQ